MQAQCLKILIEEEGFTDSKIQIKDIQQSSFNQIFVKLPEAKELIKIQRPTDYHPRILALDSPMKLLPVQTQSNSKDIYIPIEQFSQKGSGQKKNIEGKGHTLQSYFSQDHFKCAYKKATDKKQPETTKIDFTSKNKILNFCRDYDQKLYCRLQNSAYTTNQSEKTIQFDSNFESANLGFAYLNTNNNQYYLLLQNDTNSHGFNHWFFFSVFNRASTKITINIVNFIKKQAMYKFGMKISVFSAAAYKNTKRGWFKSGSNINYSNTYIPRPNKQNCTFYCLSFDYLFQEKNDRVYFALNKPYTYSKLVHFIKEIQPKFLRQNIFYYKKCIGYTLSNNSIPALVITENTQISKKVLLFLARQHPGETVGSYVIQGILQFLSEQSIQARLILQKFRVVIIPMVNPDGVIYGNSRCNLAGYDLNRQWGAQILKELTPQTFSIKKYIKTLEIKYGIECTIDIHGHSKKMKSFFYACKRQNRCITRLLSVIMSKVEDNFDVFRCTYGLTKDKINTIRGQLHQMGINCLTLQNSYYGAQKHDIKCHYSDQDLKNIGASVIKSLFVMYSSEDQSKQLYGFSRQSISEYIFSNIETYEACQAQNKSNAESQSDPQGDLLQNQQRLNTIDQKSSVNNISLLNMFFNANNNKQKINMNKTKTNSFISSRNNSKFKEQEKIEKTEKRKIISVLSKDAYIKNQKLSERKIQTPISKKLNRGDKINNRSEKITTICDLNESINIKTNKDSSAIVTSYKPSGQSLRMYTSLHKDYAYLKKRKIILNNQPLHNKTEGDLESQQTIKKKKQNRSMITEETQLNSICDLENNIYKVESRPNLQQDQNMQIETFYIKSRREKQFLIPRPAVLTRKVSKQTKNFTKRPIQSNIVQRFKKTEMFLSETQKYSKLKAKYKSHLFNNNSVFYHFPVL